ncbi:MAG: hypothetical protein ACREV1_10120 [Gammaproteobacteria bacterium]
MLRSLRLPTEHGSAATADADSVQHALKTTYGLYRNRDAWLLLAERIREGAGADASPHRVEREVDIRLSRSIGPVSR